ncbi:MAG: PP2C family protein-serine/threonine phosphatase [Planctomycetota bacterium]|jgi:sigma-B regulation protein RsbU (phosphoserine phosphatase)
MPEKPSDKILIVDDEINYRMMLRGLLEKKGFTVIEAEDGEAGVTMAEEASPSLILMDVNMPKLKGSDAVKILKENPATKDIPIIVVSAREDSDDLLNSFKYGASDYVRKVFHHEELLARINTHLSISHLREELVSANDKLKAAKHKLENDLDYAGEIQKSILAQVLPEVDGFNFSCRYFPCDATSGDHFSAFWLDEDNIGICVADASGHGVGAAMLAVFLKGQLESICRYDASARSKFRTPAEVMSLINKSLCTKVFGQEFISAVYGILNLSTREFCYSNAGHPYPVVIDADGSVSELETGNTILGIFPEAQYNDKTITLKKGQSVFLYTDGLIEARRPDSAQYGIERLLNNLSMGIADNTDDLSERIVNSVNNFCEGLELEDDLTILLFKHN